jgi:hypothetical protein
MPSGLSSSHNATAQAPAPHNADHEDHAGHDGGDDDEEMAYYMYNHLEFTVLLHRADASTMSSPSLGAATALSDGAPPGALRRAIGGSAAAAKNGGDGDPGWLVVGFEVLPCSVAQEALPGLPPYTPEADRIAATASDASTATLDAPAACASASTPGARVAAGEVLSFTYSVRFVESPIAWVNRWDAYLDMGTNDEDVHWVRPCAAEAMRGVRGLCLHAVRSCIVRAWHRFSFVFLPQFSIMNSLVLVIALGGARHAARADDR